MNKEETISAYYDAMASKNRKLLSDILHPYLAFLSSYSTYSNSDKMLDDVWTHLGVTQAEKIQIFKNTEDEYMAKYQIQPEDKVVQNVEYFPF